MKITSVIVSVPSFGDSFFILSVTLTDRKAAVFPSPHSGILFLLTAAEAYPTSLIKVFPSPHSGILFYRCVCWREISSYRVWFPSPHSGILFL